jgi:hypothetical protein
LPFIRTLFFNSIIDNEPTPALVKRFPFQLTLFLNRSASPILPFLWFTKKHYFHEKVMKSYFKIGRLKFPLQSRLEGYDNLSGGFPVFSVQYAVS